MKKTSRGRMSQREVGIARAVGSVAADCDLPAILSVQVPDGPSGFALKFPHELRGKLTGGKEVDSGSLVAGYKRFFDVSRVHGAANLKTG
jgi:hypothetical protein